MTTEYPFVVYYRADKTYGTTKASNNRLADPATNDNDGNGSAITRVWRFTGYNGHTENSNSTEFTNAAMGSGKQDVYTYAFDDQINVRTTMTKTEADEPHYDATDDYKNHPYYKASGDPDLPNSGFKPFFNANDDVNVVLRFYYILIDGISSNEYVEWVGKIRDVAVDGQPGETITKYNVNFTFFKDTEN